MRSRPIQSYRARTLSSPGFTLIELLVVISIIALLIGILLPALGSARDSARAAQCLAHVRGLTQTTYNYSTDNNSYFPLRPNGGVGGGGVWGAFWSSRKLIEYEGGNRNLNIFADPADGDPSRLYPLGGDTAYTSAGVGSAISWGTDHTATVGAGAQPNVLGLGHLYGSGDNDDSIVTRVSYGINTNLTLHADNSSTPAPPTGTRYDLVNANKIDQYNYPTQTLVYADSTWVNSRGLTYDVNASIGAADPLAPVGNFGYFLRYRTAFANFTGSRLTWTANVFGSAVASQANVDGQSYHKLKGNVLAVRSNNNAWTSYSFGGTQTAASAIFDYATGKWTSGVPTFNADAKLFARHPGGNNNISFIDGSARSVSQAESVDFTPVAAGLGGYGTRGLPAANYTGTPTNTAPLAKIIYSALEKPK